MEPSTPIKRLKRLLTSGNLWLYLLSLISRKGRLYAYKLDLQIEKRFMFRPDRIMVYVVLYRLESEGLIKSKFEERRKYYTIEPKGRKALASARSHFRMLAKRL